MSKATIEIEGITKDFELVKKEFKTGSRGYWAGGKLQVGDVKYQCNLLIIEIGSKPKKEKSD